MVCWTPLLRAYPTLELKTRYRIPSGKMGSLHNSAISPTYLTARASPAFVEKQTIRTHLPLDHQQLGWGSPMKRDTETEDESVKHQ